MFVTCEYHIRTIFNNGPESTAIRSFKPIVRMMKDSNCYIGGDITQQNTWLDEDNQQRIQITVPNTPLTGQNLKIVRQFHKNNENYLVVELSNGHTQLIPARWAEAVDFASQPSQVGQVLFSSASLRALIRMVTNLKNQRQPEECNGNDTLDSTVDDLQSRNASADDLFVDRSASPTNSQPSVAPEERRCR